ncbi:MAG: ThiF family adenylyltransferase [Candidatus Marinimicrobia bacterium]|nr:ThiF family adenylyltransferase [Candidatus Neomarinimicrobiota bacterium]
MKRGLSVPDSDSLNLDRYVRQMRYPPLGEEGQRRLSSARALLIGCGALGSVIANTLVRSGVGFLRIVDRDFLELNNLQRQVLYDEADVEADLPKAIAAAAFVPASSTLSRDLHGTVGTYIYLSSGQSMYANVDLPDGVTVTGLTAWLYDNHASAYVAVYLRREPLSSLGGSQQTLAQVATTAAGASATLYELTDVSISTAVIDNSTYKYSLKFYSPNASTATSNARLHSVRIKYSTGSPL